MDSYWHLSISIYFYATSYVHGYVWRTPSHYLMQTLFNTLHDAIKNGDMSAGWISKRARRFFRVVFPCNGFDGEGSGEDKSASGGNISGRLVKYGVMLRERLKRIFEGWKTLLYMDRHSLRLYFSTSLRYV